MEYEKMEFRLRAFIPLAEIIKRNYNEREVVLYGDSQALRDLLSIYYGIDTKIIVTGIKEKVNEDVKYIYDFVGMADKYYIAVPFLDLNEKIKQLFNSMGYKEFADFVFRIHKPIISEEGFSNYHDEYGNEINAPVGVKILLDSKSGNNKIDINSNTEFGISGNIKLYGCNINITICENVRISKGFELRAYSDSSLLIGSDCSFFYNNTISLSHGGIITIGNDCMFSHDINLLCGDGHAVFDVETGKRVLDVSRANSRNSIVLKDHVWVGLNAVILNNTVIERSSIIGAGSIVKGKFPNNCAIAGNPAKIIRKNVTWSRNNYEEDMNNCGKENIALTQ